MFLSGADLLVWEGTLWALQKRRRKWTLTVFLLLVSSIFLLVSICLCILAWLLFFCLLLSGCQHTTPTSSSQSSSLCTSLSTLTSSCPSSWLSYTTTIKNTWRYSHVTVFCAGSLYFYNFFKKYHTVQKFWATPHLKKTTHTWHRTWEMYLDLHLIYLLFTEALLQIVSVEA